MSPEGKRRDTVSIDPFQIHNRNNLLKDVAMEIFLESGETILIVFPNSERRIQLRNYLESKKMGHLFAQNDHLLQV